MALPTFLFYSFFLFCILIVFLSVFVFCMSRCFDAGLHCSTTKDSFKQLRKRCSFTYVLERSLGLSEKRVKKLSPLCPEAFIALSVGNRNAASTSLDFARYTVIQGVFLTGPPLNLQSVGRLVTNLKKTLESQTGPPKDKKSLSA